MIKCPLLSEVPNVIEAIDGEIAYVNTLTDVGRADQEDYGVQGQLVTLERYTRKAFDAWTDNPSNEQALDALRKCAAIAIRALIRYGCPVRTFEFSKS